jgi:hypothetical protein
VILLILAFQWLIGALAETLTFQCLRRLIRRMWLVCIVSGLVSPVIGLVAVLYASRLLPDSSCWTDPEAYLLSVSIFGIIPAAVLALAFGLGLGQRKSAEHPATG